MDAKMIPGVKQVHFNGSDYDPERDDNRLSKQLFRIYSYMSDGGWRTLAQISAATDAPEPSVSAQLRHLRKKRFGSYIVNKEYCGSGLFKYQVLPGETLCLTKNA